MGLHFDLTVPFARYVLENAGKLAFPFRRYQIQKVWRGERPQEGRFREFTQADIDVVGLTDVARTLRIVDKLDKIGPQKVTALLIEAGATPEQAEHALALAAISSTDLSFVDAVRALGVEHPTLDEGLDALAAVITAGRAQAPGVLVADLKIARGLDYYTGTVYETQLVGSESWGSVCSGGRYDSLASDGRTTYPGVGISIGLTRLVHLLVTRRRPGRGQRRGLTRRVTRRRRGTAGPRHPVRDRSERGPFRQADPLRRPSRHPLRLVPRRCWR